MRMTRGVSRQLPVPGADPSLSPNWRTEAVQAAAFREWNFQMETSPERNAERREPFTS